MAGAQYQIGIVKARWVGVGAFDAHTEQLLGPGTGYAGGAFALPFRRVAARIVQCSHLALGEDLLHLAESPAMSREPQPRDTSSVASVPHERRRRAIPAELAQALARDPKSVRLAVQAIATDQASSHQRSQASVCIGPACPEQRAHVSAQHQLLARDERKHLPSFSAGQEHHHRTPSSVRRIGSEARASGLGYLVPDSDIYD